MKIRSIIIGAFLFPVLVSGQAFQIDKPPLPIDSLRKALPFLRDSARVDCLNELARSYAETRTAMLSDSAWSLARQADEEASALNYIKGMGDASLRFGLFAQWRFFDSGEMEKYFREAISWYEKIPDDERLGHAFMGLGTALLKRSTPDNAKKAFERSAVHFRKAGNRVMLAEINDQFGYVYHEKGDFEKYFESIKQGIKEKKRIGDSRGIIWSLYRLAHIYRTVGDHETALDYFRQSYMQARSQGIRWNIYRSMGNVFLDLKNYDSSIYYFQQALKNMLPNDGPSLAGLGKLYMLRKEYDTALHYLQKALTSFKKRDNDNGVMWTLVDMGKSYIGLKQLAKALMCARRSLTISDRLDTKDVKWLAYEIHWKVYETLQQSDSAYFYFKKFVTLKDSLEDAKFRRQTIQKLALYKVESKEEQQQARINLLNKDNQIKNQQLKDESVMKKILIASLVVFVMIGTIIFRNTTLKSKNERHRHELAENELQIQKLESDKAKAELQQKATELEIQALRAQMNPHFIFNCLSSINRFILKNESEAASDYLTKFSRLIRMVLNNSNKSMIIMEDELEMLRLYLDLERLRFKNSFDYTISFYNNFDAASIFLPPLLLQPFAENAIWHGLMNKQGQGALEVGFELKTNMLCCYITDNGVGRKKAEALNSKSAEKQKSMGMQITAERLALLNKDVEKTTVTVQDLVDAEGQAAGTRVTIEIRYREAITEFHETKL
ncbi:tetratricopeptide repeat-containing sensor histidine kinase [Flavitalea antarctica]